MSPTIIVRVALELLYAITHAGRDPVTGERIPIVSGLIGLGIIAGIFAGAVLLFG